MTSDWGSAPTFVTTWTDGYADPDDVEKPSAAFDPNAALEPLKSFILSGGTPQAAWMHFARNVCRRAERLVSELMSVPEEKDRVNGEVLRYLNRLSDLLFVLGRVLNGHGQLDVLWKPGQRQE